MPLADLLETYGNCVVALINHQAMKLVHIQLGEIAGSEVVSGEEVRNLSAAGGSREAGTVRGSSPASHNREVVKANWKTFADALDGFARQSKATAILLAGSEETVAQFKEMLPSAWRVRFQGTFTASMTTAEKDIREQALAKLQAHQKAVQGELIDSIRAAAAREANGIVGAANTLEALHAGRVHTLALVEGLHTPGYRCTGCGFVTTIPVDSCQFCGSSQAAIPNVAEYAVRQVVDQGGTVEFLEEGTLLDQFEGIAALLRY
jgi:peptide subunit release factor 1 (eRF1)